MTKSYAAPQAFSTEPRPPIALKPVESSRIKEIGYDEATQTLAVTFTRGTPAVYHYPNVAPAFYQQFLAAESLGVFFGQNVQQLPFTKYRAEETAAA